MCTSCGFHVILLQMFTFTYTSYLPSRVTQMQDVISVIYPDTKAEYDCCCVSLFYGVDYQLIIEGRFTRLLPYFERCDTAQYSGTIGYHDKQKRCRRDYYMALTTISHYYTRQSIGLLQTMSDPAKRRTLCQHYDQTKEKPPSNVNVSSQLKSNQYI